MAELRPLDTMPKISANTPVTLGLFLTMASALFFAGMGWQRLQTNEEADRKRDIAIERLTTLGADNKARLDLLEARIERELRTPPPP